MRKFVMHSNWKGDTTSAFFLENFRTKFFSVKYRALQGDHDSCLQSLPGSMMGIGRDGTAPISCHFPAALTNQKGDQTSRVVLHLCTLVWHNMEWGTAHGGGGAK
jgi:hypothetical protein